MHSCSLDDCAVTSMTSHKSTFAVFGCTPKLFKFHCLKWKGVWNHERQRCILPQGIWIWYNFRPIAWAIGLVQQFRMVGSFNSRRDGWLLELMESPKPRILTVYLSHHSRTTEQVKPRFWFNLWLVLEDILLLVIMDGSVYQQTKE